MCEEHTEMLNQIKRTNDLLVLLIELVIHTHDYTDVLPFTQKVNQLK